MGNIVSLLTQKLTEWNGPLLQAVSQSITYAGILQQQLAPIVLEFGITMTNFNVRLDVVDSEQRRDANELGRRNRDAYIGRMAIGAGRGAEQAALAQGQQQAYQTYGTTYQQAQVLRAMNGAAANQGGDAGSLVGAGIGLTVGAGLGQIVPGLMNQTMQSAADADPNHSTEDHAAQQESSPEGQDVSVQRSDPVQRLGNLKKMLESGLITDNEFAAKKAEILKSL